MSAPKVETGDLQPETGLKHRGPFFDDQTKANTCICCLELYWYETGPACACMYADHWVQDELKRVACPFHVEQKIKDRLFGALSGDFETPEGKIAYKKPTEGAVAPIVHGKNLRTGER